LPFWLAEAALAEADAMPARTDMARTVEIIVLMIISRSRPCQIDTLIESTGELCSV
jgi:hypothetical protein